MKKYIGGFLLISILAALLTACNSDVKNSGSAQATQEGQTTRAITAQVTESEQKPQYKNGELTQKLGKELNELFSSGTYYFKEVTDSFQDEGSDLHVSVCVTDRDKYYMLDYNSADGENNDAVSGFLCIDNVVYNVDDTKKQISRITGKSLLFDWAKESYPNQLPPIAKYNKTSFVEEDGKQLTCEAYDGEDVIYNYYYEGEKLSRIDCIYDGAVIWSSTIQYSKEIDKSIFELPADYETIDVDAGY